MRDYAGVGNERGDLKRFGDTGSGEAEFASCAQGEAKGGRGDKKMIKSIQMWKYWLDPCFLLLNDNLVILICINSTRLAKDHKQMKRSTFY